MHVDIETLEQATLDAVVPAAMESLPGWLLPFDRSTIGRAISAVPLQHHGLSTSHITTIEDRYTVRGLPAQFRIADVPGLLHIQQALDSKGYAAHQATLTMVCDRVAWRLPDTRWKVWLSDTPQLQWQSVYTASDFDPVDGANRSQALSRSQCVSYAWIEREGVGVAAATASISRGWMSLHGIRTLGPVRGQGCASALIAALGALASQQGMQKCFLQVDESNTPAVALYQRLGFQTVWRYHYWRTTG